jgi:hypothetical protein
MIYWEKLETSIASWHVYRAAVPGGWLLTFSIEGGLTFMPDPEHEWDGDSLDDDPYDEGDDSLD